MSDPLPAPSLSTVLQALLTALVSLPLVLLHLITSVLLRVSNGVDATLGPSSFTTFLDSRLDPRNMLHVFGGAEFLLEEIQDLVAVGDERLVRVLEGLIR